MISKSYLSFGPWKSTGIIVSPPSNILYDKTGKQVIAGALEKIQVWNVRQGTVNATLSVDTTKQKIYVSKICLNFDGDVLASGYSDGSICIWDIKNSVLTSKFNGHKSEITALCFCKSGHLISGSKDTEIIFWDIVLEQGLFKLSGHKNVVTHLKFIEKTKTLVSSSKDFLLKFWDITTRHCVQTFSSHPSEIWSFDINPDETRLVTLCKDSVLRFFKIISPDEQNDKPDTPAVDLFNRVEFIGTIPRKGKGAGGVFMSTKFSQDGKELVVQDGPMLEIFEVYEKEKQKSKLNRLRKKILKKQYQQTPTTTEEQEEKKTTLTEQELEQEINSLRATTEFGSSRFCTVDCKILSLDIFSMKKPNEIVLALTNNTIEVLKVKDKGNIERTLSHSLPGHRSDIHTIALSSHDEMIMSASSSEVKIWNVHSLNCIRSIETNYVLCGFFVPGDRHIIVGTKQGTIELYDLHSATALETNTTVHSQQIYSLQLFPDKSGFVSGGADKRLAFWKFDSQTEKVSGLNLKRLVLVPTQTAEMEDGILCIKYSPNGKFLAVGLMNYTIRIYFVDSMKFYLSLYGHKLQVFSIDISSDSTLLVSGSGDKSVKIWGMDFGDCHKTLIAHDNGVMQVAFVPDTHYFFTSGKDGLIKYWDADKFEHILTLNGHYGEIWGLSVSKEATGLYTVGNDRAIRVWRQTDEQIFLNSKKDQEMEEMWDKELERDSARFVVPTDEASVPTRVTGEITTQADRILEALDLLYEEKKKKDQYEKDLKIAKSITDIMEDKVTVSEPEPSPLLMGKSWPDYLFWVISGVKASNLESALKILPFSQIIQLLGYLDIWITSRRELIICSRILFYLLRHYQVQLSANKTVFETILHMQIEMHTYIEQIRGITEYNIAAMNLLKKQIKQTDPHDFFVTSDKLYESKKKQNTKPKPSPKQYWKELSSNSEESAALEIDDE